MANQTNRENLGPAERIIATLLANSDHAVHNRPGVVSPSSASPTGVAWQYVTTKEEGGVTSVYALAKVGRKVQQTLLGTLQPNGAVVSYGRTVGQFRKAGLFPEVLAWMYTQIAEVWRLDNEFAARWASYAFGEEHRDLKAVLAAFMLVQSRKGDPIRNEAGEVQFSDEDFRDVGEAMLLVARKDKRDFNPKMLLRVGEILRLPEIAAINRKLGFGLSPKNPPMGRYIGVVTKWLRYREQNPRVLQGLVRAGFRTTVMALCQMAGYKPETEAFFETLRWRQKQSADGRRVLALGRTYAQDSWAGLSESQICEQIVAQRMGLKAVTGRIPATIGLTAAVLAATLSVGGISDKDLIILTPTLEELGVLQGTNPIKARWEAALKTAEDQRALNISSRVRSAEVKASLEKASDDATARVIAEVTRDMRIYVLVDISGSMQGAIETAKRYLTQFLGSIPLDRLHVAVFNTAGRVVRIPAASAAGVTQAFVGIMAGGGTVHRSGVQALAAFPPQPQEDTLLIVVGDEGEYGSTATATAIQQAGLRPSAIGMIRVGSSFGTHVSETATALGVPYLPLDESIFADPYAVPRTIRNLIAATPVGSRPMGSPVSVRTSLVDQILKTELLAKPAWA